MLYQMKLQQNMINPLLRGADIINVINIIERHDSSPPARGRRLRNWVIIWIRLIHPLLRGADACRVSLLYGFCDSSPPARGRHARNVTASPHFRFIPSCEGQTSLNAWTTSSLTIHPLLRGADCCRMSLKVRLPDSSPPARGRRSVFMLSLIHI